MVWPVKWICTSGCNGVSLNHLRHVKGMGCFEKAISLLDSKHAGWDAAGREGYVHAMAMTKTMRESNWSSTIPPSATDERKQNCGRYCSAVKTCRSQQCVIMPTIRKRQASECYALIGVPMHLLSRTQTPCSHRSRKGDKTCICPCGWQVCERRENGYHRPVP